MAGGYNLKQFRTARKAKPSLKTNVQRPIKLSPKQLIELQKCAQDPVYFLLNYAYIKHPTRGTIPFALYPRQKDLVGTFKQNRQVIINKSRQIGISTTIAGYVAWLIWYYKDQEVLVIATKKKVAANIIKKVKTILRHMPSFMKQLTYISVDNIFSVELLNGSRVEAISKTPDAGRSEGLSLLIIDEAAHIDTFEEIWRASRPTISTGGKVIICSTPKGSGGVFHDLCKEAMITDKEGTPGKNGMVYIELPWQTVTEHDDSWFYNETKGLSSRDIRQEYLCSFVGSGDTVLDPETLDMISKEVSENKIYHKDLKHKMITIYREYNPKATYLLTGDTSRGDAGDYTGLQVWEVISRDEMYEAATLKDKLPYDKVADLVEHLYKLYKEPLIAIESNYLGVVVMSELYKKGCNKVYYSMLKKDVDEYSSNESKEEQLKKVPGFTTSKKTRDVAISIWERKMREGKCHIFSKLTLDEFTTFVWKRNPTNVKAESQTGSHDDLVMSSVIANYIVETEFDKLLASYSTLEALYDNIRIVKTNVSDLLTSQDSRKPHDENETDEKKKNRELLEKLEGRFSDSVNAFSFSSGNNQNKNLVEQYKSQKSLREMFPELFDP